MKEQEYLAKVVLTVSAETKEKARKKALILLVHMNEDDVEIVEQ